MRSILQPYLTEKSAAALDAGLYVFLVHPDANKDTIAKELKSVYNVDASSVRIVNLPAKAVTFRRQPGKRQARRKAYVQLLPKQKIAGFESLVEKDKAEKKEETK